MKTPHTTNLTQYHVPEPEQYIPRFCSVSPLEKAALSYHSAHLTGKPAECTRWLWGVVIPSFNGVFAVGDFLLSSLLLGLLISVSIFLLQVERHIQPRKRQGDLLLRTIFNVQRTPVERLRRRFNLADFELRCLGVDIYNTNPRVG
jgi:hypothetical protein